MVATPRVLRVALTGGIATGKSHVRAEFERLGVPTIDSDQLARQVVAAGSPGLAAIVQRFGRGMVDAEGALDRRAMAHLVFGDPEARKALEAIVHPAVRRMIDDWFASLDPARVPYALADIPLLYETERDRDFDVTIVTLCDTLTQLRRLMSRDGLSEADARRRMAAQLPPDEKAARATYVIRTDGKVDEVRRDVVRVHTAILARRSPLEP